MRRLFFLILFVAVSCALAFLYSRSESSQLLGELVDRVETSEKVVALTFDDGPTPGYTEAVLEILRQENIKATFFLVGKVVIRNKSQAVQIVEAGHELGNHSWSHSRMVLKSPGFISREIEDTDRVIREIGYAGNLHFRPPFGKKLFVLPYYLKKSKRTSIMWDVAPERSLGKSASSDELTRFVLAETKPGSVILLHVMYVSREESMRSTSNIIKGLKEQGYRFLTVSQLLEHSSGED